MKEIIRTDILTNKKYKKEQLIRIAILKDKTTILNNDFLGRGLYFHPKNLINKKRWMLLKFKIEKSGGNFSQISDQLSSFYQGGNFDGEKKQEQ